MEPEKLDRELAEKDAIAFMIEEISNSISETDRYFRVFERLCRTFESTFTLSKPERKQLRSIYGRVMRQEEEGHA